MTPRLARRSGVRANIVETYQSDPRISELTRLISSHAPAHHTDPWGIPACRGAACLMYGLFLVQLHQAVTRQDERARTPQVERQLADLLKARDQAMKRALSYGGLRFLNRILASRSFLHCTLKAYCVPLLSEALKTTIKCVAARWVCAGATPPRRGTVAHAADHLGCLCCGMLQVPRVQPTPELVPESPGGV